MTHQDTTSAAPEETAPAESSSCCSNVPDTEEQRELSKILKSMRHDPTGMGCFSLGKDGIYRSLTADRDVLDAVPFNPRLIEALLDRMDIPQDDRHEFHGVDGTDVPREQWFHPDKSLLPQPLTEEQKEADRKMIEEYKAIIDEKKKKLNLAES